MRAANVGGTNVFRPAQLASRLKRLDLVNIGAAGTFVVRASASAADIRQAFAAALPFEPVLAIRPAREVVALVRAQPFQAVTLSKDLRGWIGVMTDRPRQQPALPHLMPAGPGWHFRLDTVTGRFAVGLLRRQPERQIYPGAAMEAAFGVPLTVRWWETFVKIAALLDA